MINLHSVRLVARHRMWAGQLTFDAVAVRHPFAMSAKRGWERLADMSQTDYRPAQHDDVVDPTRQARLESRRARSAGADDAVGQQEITL